MSKMGPYGKMKTDVDKWLSKDPLIKKSTPTHVALKPTSPDLKVKSSSTDPKKVKKWGFLSKPGEGGQNIVVGGVGVESKHAKGSAIRVQPTKPGEWSGTTVIQGEGKVGKFGIGGRYDTSSKKFSPWVSFKSSISSLVKRKKQKPKDFGYKY